MFVENISSCPEGNWVQLVIQLVVDTVVEPHSKVEITPRWRAMAKQLIRDNKLPDMPLVDIYFHTISYAYIRNSYRELFYYDRCFMQGI
jgi:hypothetical protein